MFFLSILIILHLLEQHLVTPFISTRSHTTKHHVLCNGGQSSFSCLWTAAPVPVGSCTSKSGGPFSFQQEVENFLIEHNVTYTLKEMNTQREGVPVKILLVEGSASKSKLQLGLHILPYPDSFETSMAANPTICKKLTEHIYDDDYHHADEDENDKNDEDDDIKQLEFPIIHLHEDVWRNKNSIVKARILAKLNIVNNRWFARNTVVERIPMQRAMDFLQEHHLWGSTRAKFNYGLFWNNKKKKKNKGGGGNIEIDADAELLAVATFSPRRHVRRYGSERMYRSHELIRYCAKKDEVVLGGITKLLAAFCRDTAPDDIVTCIDRDFGDGEGWAKIGFENVQVMPPLVMAVALREREKGEASASCTCTHSQMKIIRHYLVGAGIGASQPEGHAKFRQERPGIPSKVLSELEHVNDNVEATEILMKHGFFPVFDSGVERRILIVQKSKLRHHSNGKKEDLGLEDIDIPEDVSVMDIWQNSSPSFPDRYYSQNRGIQFMLEAAAS